MPFTVSPAALAVRATACEWLVSHLPVADCEAASHRYLALLASGELDPAGLFVACDPADSLRGVILAQVVPGALGLIWRPRTDGTSQRDEIASALAAGAIAWMRSRGVKVGQSFAAAADRPEYAALERAGFRRVTEVIHFHRTSSHLEEADDSPIDLVPYAADPAAFAVALARTYDGSLDCPELTGERTAEELVDGFRGVGSPDAAWWFTVQVGEPVGVVMWERAPEPATLELGYLGLIPSARGRGLGDQLVRETLRFAHKRDLATVALSVDTRNGPAIQLYRRHGFEEYDRRDVYLASWTAASC